MSSGEIESFRVGKPWRTSRQHLRAYELRQFELSQRGPRYRELLQIIACWREVERRDRLEPRQQELLDQAEAELAELQQRRLHVA
jgi:hypothetical protein